LVAFNFVFDFIKFLLFLFGFFLLVEDLFFSLLIAFLEFCELLEIGLFFAVIGEDLFFLVLKLLSGFHLFFHEFLSFE
jgi:hypothetical protein